MQKGKFRMVKQMENLNIMIVVTFTSKGLSDWQVL